MKKPSMSIDIILEQKKSIPNFYIVIIVIKLGFKRLWKVFSDLGWGFPLGGGEYLFYDHFRVANSVRILGVGYMRYQD